MIHAHTHGQPGGLGVANRIADGFGDDGVGMVGKFAGNRRQGSGYLQRGCDIPVFGQLGNPVLDSLAEVLLFRDRRLQLENCRPNVLAPPLCRR